MIKLITQIAVYILIGFAVACLIASRRASSFEYETRLRLQAIQLTAIAILLLHSAA